MAAGLDNLAFGSHGRGAGALPVPLTRLIGREQEVARVVDRLCTSRLLTLTGSGGVGKTRVAIAVVHALAPSFADGAAWVELAPLADPGLVPQTVAVAVGIREAPGRELADSLLAGLRERHLLLVIDNAEQVVDAVARLVEALLAGCPRVTVLATSREPLAIPAEVAWRVPSLAVPDPAVQPSGGLAAVAAVALFLDRARAARSDFTLTPENAPAIAEICGRLDGIPLAIELAAARVRALAPAEIAARLADGFGLLTAGSRTAPPRQQTLLATLDWSYALLPDAEQRLLGRLAVFAGGWTLEAAEAVCAGEGIEPETAPELVAPLVDKSLVQAEARGAATRYRLLETIRQYAGDKLRAAGEAATTLNRHRDWCLALAEQALPRLWTRDQLGWLDRLDMEHDNLRAALDWSHADPAGAAAELRLAGALAEFWDWHGHHTEARARLAAALARDDGALPAVRALVLDWAGRLATFDGDLDRARALLEEGLALARAVGAPQPIARLLRHLATVDFRLGREAESETLRAEGLALARQAGEPHELAMALIQRAASHALRSDLTAAAPFLEEGLAVARAASDRMTSSVALSFLAGLTLAAGETGRGERLAEESLALARAIGFRRNMIGGLGLLGDAARLRGDLAAAEARYHESLRLARDLGDRAALALAVIRLAGLWAARGEHRRAAWLFGTVEGWRGLAGAGQADWYPRQRHDQDVAAARAALGEAAFAAAWTEGQALTLDEAAAAALRVELPAGAAGSGDAGASAQLTAREREVAGLIVRGLTNRQIADSLSISRNTVERHVENILNRLGLTSRAQVAAWAVAHGLTSTPET